MVQHPTFAADDDLAGAASSGRVTGQPSGYLSAKQVMSESGEFPSTSRFAGWGRVILGTLTSLRVLPVSADELDAPIERRRLRNCERRTAVVRSFLARGRARFLARALGPGSGRLQSLSARETLGSEFGLLPP